MRRVRTRAIRVIVLIGVALVILLFVIGDPVQWVLDLLRRVDLSDAEAVGAELVQQNGCRNCHIIAGAGSVLGPPLDDITQRLDDEQIRRWLRNPSSMRSGTRMPIFWLSNDEMTAIIAYLDSQSR